jgi:hypothetical protein
MGRATQGVTLINLGTDERLAGLETVVDRDDAELPEGEGGLASESGTPDESEPGDAVEPPDGDAGGNAEGNDIDSE